MGNRLAAIWISEIIHVIYKYSRIFWSLFINNYKYGFYSILESFNYYCLILQLINLEKAENRAKKIIETIIANE